MSKHFLHRPAAERRSGREDQFLLSKLVLNLEHGDCSSCLIHSEATMR